MINLYLMVIIFSGIYVESKECFPKDFLFGVATAAYQIEGAWNQDGKGEHMWDWYVHNFPKRIDDGTTADIACDSYNKYEEDFKLLVTLGVNVYRFSISWSRILPNGTIDYINQEGVDHYLIIFKILKKLKIEPLVTLYHWDLPQPFNEMGGWTNPRLVDYFGDYARLCFKLFGKYVKYWATFNEPQMICRWGYELGVHAPGYKLLGIGIYECAYTVLKSHALAYHIYHDEYFEKQRGKISMVLHSFWYKPNGSSTQDIESQKIAIEFDMGIFANPIHNGNWPQVVIDRVAKRSQLAGLARSRLPQFNDEEIRYINGTSDYFAINYYITMYSYPQFAITDYPKNTSYELDRGVGTIVDPAWPNWGVFFSYPPGLREIVNYIHKTYSQPDIFITENGWPESNFNDSQRISYLGDHLKNLSAAINEDKVSVLGYTAWTLLDDFEWSSGYTAKFGLVSVDFSDVNRPRTPKPSFYWFENVVKTKCVK